MAFGAVATEKAMSCSPRKVANAYFGDLCKRTLTLTPINSVEKAEGSVEKAESLTRDKESRNGEREGEGERVAEL